MNYPEGSFCSNTTGYKVKKQLNYAPELSEDSNCLHNSRSNSKVININLERIKDELENTNKGEPQLQFCFTNTENMSNLLSAQPENSIMSQLSSKQLEEIKRIRQEGSDRCQLILDKIGVIKSKTEDVLSNSESRYGITKQNEQLVNKIISKNNDMMQVIKRNEANQKFERCENRINHFESAISEILSFTKQTCNDIHHLQK